MSAAMGAVRGAGLTEVEREDVAVGRERVVKDVAGERGVCRALDEGVEFGEGVTSVERKAVRRVDEPTVTGSSSRMLEGTSL